MSYEPTIWRDGDELTAARLNHIEQGITNALRVEQVELKENKVYFLDIEGIYSNEEYPTVNAFLEYIQTYFIDANFRKF